MNTPRQFFCADGCGEIVVKNEPSRCPVCGGEIQIIEKRIEKQKPPTRNERAAWWFQKMRDEISKAV